MFATIKRVDFRMPVVFGFLCAALMTFPARAAFDIFSVGGNATTSSIQPTLDTFRTALGGANNGNAAGPLAGGRREINWDGGGALVAASSGPTLTAFRNNRGGIFTTPGTGFLQTPVTDAALTGIQASYATTFGAFSPIRIFVPVGSNITDSTFALPGSNGAIPATVSGFGAIFNDVDLAATTRMEFFDVGDTSLGSFNVAPGSTVDGSFSFLGVVANAGEQIARVRITTGNQGLGLPDSNGNPVDVVGMDDFLFAEPVAIPEPTALAIGAVFCCMAVTRRRFAR